MSKFKPNPKQLVTSALIYRGRLPGNNQPIIAKCCDLQDDEQAAGNAALGLVAVGVITGAVSLASLGVGPFLLAPIASALLGGAGYYNHPIRARRRENEADFLRRNPQVTALISQKLEQGGDPETIDAALKECVKLWQAGQQGVAALVGDDPQAQPKVEPSPVEVHNHNNITNVIPGNPGGSRTAQAIPAPGQVQTEPPDLSLYADPADRAKVLMVAMGKAGMPIGSILRHPFIMAIGGSQSGKTSLSTVLSILRMATGCSVCYATVDDDVPEVRWSDLADSPPRYVEMMDHVSETISAAGKGALRGQAWVFDEVLRSSQEFGADITKLLIPSLTKGSKTGGLLVVLTHAKTVSAHNLKPGFSEAWERDRVAIEALRVKDEYGEYSPKGEYLVTIPDEPPSVWRWPEWMVTGLDPVGWVLDAFPEFKAGAQSGTDRVQTNPSTSGNPTPAKGSPGHRAQGAGVSLEALISTSESAGTLSPACPGYPAPCATQGDNPAVVTLDELPFEGCSAQEAAVIRWMEKRGLKGATVGDLLAAKLAALKGAGADEVRGVLASLTTGMVLRLEGSRYRIW